MATAQSSNLYPVRTVRPTRPQGRASTKPYERKQETLQNSKLVTPLIVLCSAVVAACLAFAEPPVFDAPTQRDAPVVAPTPSNNNDILSLPVSDSATRMPSNAESMIVAQHTAVSQSTDLDRAENLRLAAQAINGTVIEPGQVFSFNDVVGDTESNGDYRIALVVLGNTLSYARGGGICQVSTALYIAALQADMEIVERHPHTLAPDYAPIGLDATLAYGTLDLQLKNTSNYPVFISAETVGQTVTVKIIGVPLAEGTSIAAEATIVGRIDRNGNYLSDGVGNNLSETAYYITESYRVYYKDGVNVGQEYLSTDTYEVSKDF